MADPLDRAMNGAQFGKLWGHGVDSVFPEGSSGMRTVPWKAAGRSKTHLEYDADLVRGALSGQPQLEDVDPRGLRATQPSVTKGGVDYYADSPDYNETGKTFADNDKPANKFPIVYRRDDGQNLILAGHHRATAALVGGKPLQAIVVRGPWGPKRNKNPF